MLITTDNQEANLLQRMVRTIVGEVAPEAIKFCLVRERAVRHMRTQTLTC